MSRQYDEEYAKFCHQNFKILCIRRNERRLNKQRDIACTQKKHYLFKDVNIFSN